MAVHPVLQDDEIRAKLSHQRRDHAPEERDERLVPRPRRQWKVDLEALAVALPGLAREPGARKQGPAVLVEIDVEDAPGVKEPVHHPVPVVGVDVEIRHPVALV